MNIGIVYIAVGEKYVREARKSAESVKSNMPDIEITIFTDSKYDYLDIFDDIMILEQDMSHDFGDSVLRPKMIRYDKNLFLDTDTYITEDISELFDLLDKYHIIGRINPLRSDGDSHKYEETPPQSFPQYNTGVIGYRDSKKVKTFFKEWSKEYHKNKDQFSKNFNQPSFRKVLYESNIKIGSIAEEYNFRLNEPGFAEGKVKILHGRVANYKLEEIADKLNRTDKPRVIAHNRYPGKIYSGKSKVYDLKYKINTFIERIKSENLKTAIEDTARFIK